MKSQHQILSLLNLYRPKSELDRDMITGFVRKKFNVTPKTKIFSDNPGSPSIDTQTFSQWFEKGFGTSDIAKCGHATVLLGRCWTDKVTVLFYMETGAGATIRERPASDIERCTEKEANDLKEILTRSSLQLNENTDGLDTKYIPQQYDKVIFRDFAKNRTGLGIIRSVSTGTGKVDMYCYFVYPTKNCEREIGYSMHETNAVNLHDYIFERMQDSATLNGVCCMQRLGRELNKEGKTWKEKQKRIEPVSFKVQRGKPYWYISDKLKVIKTEEKETPTSQLRCIAGNYFITEEAANRMLEIIVHASQDYLASDKWPDFE